MKPLLNAEQAAKLLNLPKSWLLAEARADRIPHCRLGRYVRFDEDALEVWAKARARGPQRKEAAMKTASERCRVSALHVGARGAATPGRPDHQEET